MKLVLLLFDYFPFGGLERDCLRTALTCAARGHEVTIFTRSWQGDRPSNIPVRLFGRHGLTSTARNRHWLKQLAVTLPEADFDCVVGFNKLPGLDVYFGADLCFAAKLQATKPFWYHWLPRCRQLLELERAVFARNGKTEILLLTPGDIPNYQKFYGTENRFHILPATATRRVFTDEERQTVRRRIREANGWPLDCKVMLFVGSDFQRKGLDRAIRGLASLPADLQSQIQFAVLGQCEPGKFAQLAESLRVKDRIHFLGGRTDAPDWMLGADVLVHPARSETAGTVIVEAITAGLPVLVTGVCGYAFHVGRANAGVVFSEPFQQAEFNQALQTTFTSSDNKQWRVNALHYAAKGEIFGCHERMAEIIESVALRKHGSRPH